MKTKIRVATTMLLITLVSLTLVNCSAVTLSNPSGNPSPANGSSTDTGGVQPQIGTGGVQPQIGTGGVQPQIGPGDSVGGQAPGITNTLPGGWAGGNQPGGQPTGGSGTAPDEAAGPGGQAVSSDDSPSSTTDRPEISDVRPVRDSQTCLRPTISIGLNLTDALRTNGALDLTKVKVLVDGRDVTAQLQMLATMDYPQGHASLVYTPAEPLAAGKHKATVSYATAKGMSEYAWEFVTADIPCP